MTRQSFTGMTSTGEEEVGTPDDIYLPLHEEFGFTFDLAATPENTKVPGAFFTKEDDALSKDWPRNGANWLNPPYSRRLRRWLEKASREADMGASTVVLVRANTASWWYHNIAVPRANEIRHLEGRIHFENSIYGGNAAYFDSVVLVFRPDPPPVRRVITLGERRYVVF